MFTAALILVAVSKPRHFPQLGALAAWSDALFKLMQTYSSAREWKCI